MRSLLDTNVVIALLDPEHSFHNKAHKFWRSSKKWASCPVVENGVVRILAGANYPGFSAYSIQRVFELLGEMVSKSDHEFWADDISLLDASRFEAKLILGPKQLTDIYLLGLAASKNARLVTFDQRITPAAVIGASKKNLFVIGE